MMKEKFNFKHPIKCMKNKQNFIWRSSSLNENLNQIFNNRNAKFHTTPNSETSTGPPNLHYWVLKKKSNHSLAILN